MVIVSTGIVKEGDIPDHDGNGYLKSNAFDQSPDGSIRLSELIEMAEKKVTKLAKFNLDIAEKHPFENGDQVLPMSVAEELFVTWKENVKRYEAGDIVDLENERGSG